jgi:hypothetical protein
VREQQLDGVATEPMLAQQRRRCAPQPVRAEVRHAEVDALEEMIQRDVAHRHAASEDRRQHVLAVPADLGTWRSSSTAWRDRNTRCGLPIFMRSAGMSHCAASRSNSCHDLGHFVKPVWTSRDVLKS